MNLILKFLKVMNTINHNKEQAREFLKQEALKEINKKSNFSGFHGRVFCVIAKYGLQLEANEEGLLTGEEWSNPDCRDELFERAKQFLDKYIR